MMGHGYEYLVQNNRAMAIVALKGMAMGILGKEIVLLKGMAGAYEMCPFF